MERTESIVIQVAPDYENVKIKEMEKFGWSLQNRQEIHEEGEAYGRPSFLDSDAYIIKTKVYHYVKLHFARSLSLPNLDKIRELENEYFGLPEPSFPKQLPWMLRISIPWLLARFFGVELRGFFLFLFLGPYWYNKYKNKYENYKKEKAAADAQLEELIQKRQEILQKVAEYF